MPTFVTTRNYQDGASLTQAELDAAFNSIETFVNTTKLDSTNLQSGAVGTSQLAAAAVASTNIAANAVTTTLINDGAVTRSKLDSLEQIPTGAVFPYSVSTAPAGWLNCDGSLVSRTTYATLFATIGTTFGTGDGSTTFGLPNLCGRAPIGQGTGSGLTARTLGQTGGEETHVLTTTEIPSHSHASTFGQGFVGWQTGGDGGQVAAFQVGGVVAPTSANTAAAGSGGAHNNMSPWICLNFIIKY